MVRAHVTEFKPHHFLWPVLEPGGKGVSVTDGHEYNVGQTYLALRLGMVLLILLLLVSIGFQFASTECLQVSISAYYYTATRPIFIATLCAIGACLIVYRGNTDTENVLLDFCGFLAFVVAFVPTKVDKTCEPSNVPALGELASAVRNNVWMLLAIGAIATLVGWLLSKWQVSGHGERLSTYARRSLLASAVALGAGVVFFWGWPETFREIGHNVSAGALFVGIVAVVIVNAVGFARQQGVPTVRRVSTNRYAIVAGAMVLSALILGWVIWKIDDFKHGVFVLEFALIIEFAVFWGLQTVELGGQVTRET